MRLPQHRASTWAQALARLVLIARICTKPACAARLLPEPLRHCATARAAFRCPALAEMRHPPRLLEDDPGVIVRIGTGRLAMVLDARVRPIGYARATFAALLIAHDVSPLCSIDVAVTVRKGRVDGVGMPIVPGT